MPNHGASKQGGGSTTTVGGGSSGAKAGNGQTINGLPVGPETNPAPFGRSPVPPNNPMLPPDLAQANLATVASAPSTGPFTFPPNGNTAQWPDMCTVTNTPQLHALLAPITAVTSTEGQHAHMIGGGGGQTVNNSDCKFHLSTTFDQGANGAGGDSYVEIQVYSADSGAAQTWQMAKQQQQQLAPQHPEQWATYQLPGGVQCFDDGNSLQCLQGDVDYWVSGQKTTGGDNFGADQDAWLDQILIPLAAKFGSEIH